MVDDRQSRGVVECGPAWQDVPGVDVAFMLALFARGGQGMVRDRAVHQVSVHTEPEQPGDGEPADADVRRVVVEVVDTRHGRWRMTLSGARVSDALGAFGPDGDWDIAREVLTDGSWTVRDRIGDEYASGRPRGSGQWANWRAQRAAALARLAQDPSGVLDGVSASATATVHFSDLRVQQAAAAGRAGACPACAGESFTLQALATVPVHVRHDADGTARYVADADEVDELAATVSLTNAHAKLVCTECGTPMHTNRTSPGQLGALIGADPARAEAFGSEHSPAGLPLTALLHHPAPPRRP